MGASVRGKNEDCRAISDDFLKKFMPEESGGTGEYIAFLELVKKCRGKLVLCFRGNNADFEAVCIYYNNHLVYKIEYKKYKKNYKYKGKGERGKVTINFNHARYSENYEYFWRQINKEFGFNPEAKDTPEIKNPSVGVGYITNDINKKILENVENIYINCLHPMLNDSFDPNKTTDYFKKYAVSNEKKTVSKAKWLEKIRQQQLFCKMKSIQNGYFVFDMEFAQRSTPNKEKHKNEPDMLAVRFDEEGCAYVFVEVKCKPEACKGDSGVIAHLEAMMKYSEDDEYMKARRREAVFIMNQYKKLGLYPSLGDIKEEDFKTIESLFIFTDGAVSWIENESEMLKTKYGLEKHDDYDIHLPDCKELYLEETDTYLLRKVH
ncbi:MAG: hypothetical protein NC489_27650 [Ruminococcus flavefaciens]|nr:hypothetical protein [Ruminococcus flavefaciens]